MAENETLNIAADGDVILVVGHDKKRLRVHSMLLSCASPVFKTLFGALFREGQQERGATNPVDIALPEDDAPAMTDICELLHFQGTKPAAVTTENEELLAFAVVVDKYALHEALHLQSAGALFTWLDWHKTCTDTVILANIIGASYLLGHARCFFLAIEQLIQGSNGSLCELSKEDSLQIIPGIVLTAISERRVRTQMFLIDELTKLGLMSQRCSDCAMRPRDWYANLAKALRLVYWPPSFIATAGPVPCLAGFMNEVANLAGVVVHQKPSSYVCICIDTMTKLSFGRIVREAREKAAGLCLECVGEGANLLAPCKGEH